MKKIKNIGIIFIGIFFIMACKTNKIVTSKGEAVALSAKNIISNHYAKTLHFKTIRGKLKVHFNDGKTQENFTLNLRMKKDEAIWISAKLALVKMYITPTKVSFYNKLDDTYFEGDFTLLSDFLGTELDFDNIQNLLIGNALYNLTKEKFTAKIRDKVYELQPERDFTLFKRLFLIDASHFKIKEQHLDQSAKQQLLTIQYPEYQEIATQIVPKKIAIDAKNAQKETNIAIEYKKIALDVKVSFPFKIPSGYKEIKIK